MQTEQEIARALGETFYAEEGPIIFGTVPAEESSTELTLPSPAPVTGALGTVLPMKVWLEANHPNYSQLTKPQQSRIRKSFNDRKKLALRSGTSIVAAAAESGFVTTKSEVSFYKDGRKKITTVQVEKRKTAKSLQAELEELRAEIARLKSADNSDAIDV